MLCVFLFSFLGRTVFLEGDGYRWLLVLLDPGLMEKTFTVIACHYFILGLLSQKMLAFTLRVVVVVVVIARRQSVVFSPLLGSPRNDQWCLQGANDRGCNPVFLSSPLKSFDVFWTWLFWEIWMISRTCLMNSRCHFIKV